VLRKGSETDLKYVGPKTFFSYNLSKEVVKPSRGMGSIPNCKKLFIPYMKIYVYSYTRGKGVELVLRFQKIKTKLCFLVQHLYDHPSALDMTQNNTKATYKNNCPSQWETLLHDRTRNGT
jgi:hypothetical protein